MDVDVIKELIEEIKALRTKVENLEQHVNTTNSVIIDHIGFINGVFDTIKKPLFYVMNKVNNLLLLEGTQPTTAPQN